MLDDRIRKKFERLLIEYYNAYNSNPPKVPKILAWPYLGSDSKTYYNDPTESVTNHRWIKFIENDILHNKCLLQLANTMRFANAMHKALKEIKNETTK